MERTVVAFLARDHGLACLRCLLGSDHYRPILVYTHRLNPKIEDEARSERVDWPLYHELCEKAKVRLLAIDTIKEACDIPVCDYILSVSWRYLIPERVLQQAKVASVNIHRGRLPDFAGASPVRRQLEAGLRFVTITTHKMTETIDQGEKVWELNLPAVVYDKETIDQAEAREKREMAPYFPKLMLMTLDRLDKEAMDDKRST